MGIKRAEDARVQTLVKFPRRQICFYASHDTHSRLLQRSSWIITASAWGSQRTEVSWESSPAPSFDLYAVTRRDSFSETILRPSGHLGRWATPWSAEEMQVEQHKAVDILPMPDLLTRVSCRKYWKRISAEWSFMSPRRPIRSRD